MPFFSGARVRALSNAAIRVVSLHALFIVFERVKMPSEPLGLFCEAAHSGNVIFLPSCYHVNCVFCSCSRAKQAYLAPSGLIGLRTG